ncbi:unnamed protein product [Caenorhabditis bovis]|uniref:C2H2-type domain-containing protein n=1 Tax=Caenorhabditis bovis TaxID=2654633 RepID=A0A8S1F5B8_9PELO|nr:unnamed protein product [Caenorhabditis bovis]
MSRRPPPIPPTVQISIPDIPCTSENHAAPAGDEPAEDGSTKPASRQQHHQPLRRRPVSAMASLPWLSYQPSRDDHLADDEDIAVDSTLFLSTSPSFQPIGSSVSSLVALSPPGLSPLNFNDGSPFSLSSTPSSTSSLVTRNRFTFDHIPFVGSSNNSTPASAGANSSGLSPGAQALSSECEKSAFEIVSTTENPEDILQRVRQGTSGSSISRTNSQSQSTPEPALDKQYYCTVCKKDFKRPDILSRHLRRHTGEKPFGCDTCGRYFSRSDHLRTHRRTHTDEKPYQCTICSYSARRRDVLTRHMTTRHQTTAPQTHRNVRRCLSDGDYHKMSIQEFRQRHQTTREELDVPKMDDIEDDVIVDDID